MEQAKSTIQNIRQNQQMPTFSENRQISTPITQIDRARHAAIFTAINLVRGSLGWSLKTAKELDEQIKIWAITFDDYKIPNEYLPQLFKRARDLRIARLQNGMETPDFTAELFAACWTGQNGLKAEIERETVAEGRTLSANAESVCPRCNGTNMEYVYSPTGTHLGCRPRCKHEVLQPNEWLYKKHQENLETEVEN